jgi:two-component system, NtrC family, response regulator HydG
MTGNRLAVVADDAVLSSAIHALLKKNLELAPFLCGLTSAHDHLGRDTDGLLLVAVASLAEAEKAYRLVQEISIQQFPVQIVLIEGESLDRNEGCNNLDHHLAARLRWPDDSQRLLRITREPLGRGAGFLGTRTETLEEIISRRLLSQTPSLLPLVERIALAAIHDVTVLLTGETGTGKTFLARLMHDCSPRKSHPFLVVPCGAQPASLIESAFFGHVKGAFTGADRAKEGKFAAAGDGTLLLDEIDTLGLEQQAGLLRVIESGEYEAVGCNETKQCSARIIVASNWDLQEAADKGRFRQDLYYRLNVMSFHLPPIRERLEDIEPLVRGMAARFNTKFRKDLFEVSQQALAALQTFQWPGNIRQLENAVQQAVLVSSGPELLLDHLPQPVREYSPPPLKINGHSSGESLVHNREALEREVIQRALAANGYSRARAALSLKISRVTLYKKMKKYGLMGAPSLRSSVT